MAEIILDSDSNVRNKGYMSDPPEDLRNNEGFGPLADNWHGKILQFCNVQGGTALDLNGGSTKDGTPVQGWEFSNNNPNMCWKLERVDQDDSFSPWTLRNQASGTYLDLDGGNSENGTRIHGWSYTRGNPNQQWYINTVKRQENSNQEASDDVITEESSDRPMVTIENVATHTLVDLSGGWKGNATPVIGWERNDGSNQWWQIIPF